MGLTVLSLFDGMSSGRIALERANKPVEKYYASEVDKYAIKVTQANYPDTVQLGTVTGWEQWDIDWSSIDLVTGGFPCQAWSIAGKQLGDKDERGALFWTMLDIMKKAKENNPNVKFLIENVKMKKEFEEYITFHTEQALGKVEKHLINSALVSAQNRNRYYWTNIKNIPTIQDKDIVLQDILEEGIVDREKSHCLDANYFKGGNLKSYFEKHRRQLVFLGGLDEGLRLDNGKYLSRNYREGYRIYSVEGKSATLTAASKGGQGGYSGLYGQLESDKVYYRKLTPVECERLQTVPDNYTNHVSNTQRYKMLGNGWTVDVIAHIFKGLK